MWPKNGKIVLQIEKIEEISKNVYFLPAGLVVVLRSGFPKLYIFFSDFSPHYGIVDKGGPLIDIPKLNSNYCSIYFSQELSKESSANKKTWRIILQQSTMPKGINGEFW